MIEQRSNAPRRFDTTISIEPNGALADLRAGTEDNWNAAICHRFVDELFAGTIDPAVMRTYLIQDYQFFESFLSLLGSCVAHADRLEAKLRFGRRLGLLEADEDRYFITAFADVGVPGSVYMRARPNPATSELLTEMTRAVDSASYPDLLIVLVVAEWLYLDWGERDEPLPKDLVHARWIELHRGEDFRRWTQFLVDELERVFPDCAAARARLRSTWERIVALELEFFSLAYL